MMILKLKSVATLIIVILDYYAVSGWLNFERGDQDTFENPNCLGPCLRGCNCNGLNADCVNSTCKKCKCYRSHMTFLPFNETNGRCVKNNFLLSFPVSNNQFLVQEKNSRMCVTYYISSKLLQRNIYYIKKTVCNGADPTQLWMWTRYNQLLNMDTLKCLQKDKWDSILQHSLALEECNITEAKQIWQCRERTKINFGLKESQSYMVCGDDSDCKLKGGNDPALPSITWQRFQSGENLCSRAFGCYEFLNPLSTMFVTDLRNCRQQCEGEREIAAPRESGKTQCFIMWNRVEFLDHDKWRQLPFTDKIFTISKKSSRIVLKWNLAHASYKWTGLIIKLRFHCAQQQLTQQPTNVSCILIKFKGTVIDPTAPPSTVLSAHAMSTRRSTTTEIPSSSPSRESEEYKSNPSSVPNSLVITVVCLVVVIMVFCGILGFVFYKCRRRQGKASSNTMIQSSNDRGNLSVTERDGTTPNPIYLPAQSSSCTSSTKTDETYQEPQTGASGDCELYESGENQLASSVTQWSEDSLNPIYYPAENSKYPETGEVYQDPPNGASQECELYDSGENAIEYFAKLKKDHNKPH